MSCFDLFYKTLDMILPPLSKAIQIINSFNISLNLREIFWSHINLIDIAIIATTLNHLHHLPHRRIDKPLSLDPKLPQHPLGNRMTYTMTIPLALLTIKQVRFQEFSIVEFLHINVFKRRILRI